MEAVVAKETAKYILKAQEDHQESWLIKKGQLIIYTAINKTPTLKVYLRAGRCTLHYRGVYVVHLATLQRYQGSKRPERPIYANLAPTLALLC